MFKPGQILYTYLHLAAAYAKDLTKGMLKADIRASPSRLSRTPTAPIRSLPDERGRRQAGGPGRRDVSAEGGRRPRRAAGRRDRRTAGEGRHHRRRRRGHQRRQDRRRHGRAHGGPGRCAARLTYLDDVFGAPSRPAQQRRRHRAGVADADLVVGAVLLPGGAQAPHSSRGHAQDHEAGLGDRRRRHRSGRLLRDLQADVAHRADLRGRRRRPLLRRQHARRRRAHLDGGARGRDAAVRPRDRQQGLRAGRQGRRRARARRQRVPREARPSRRSPRLTR